MRTELRADAAVFTDNRDFHVLVKINRADDARVDAFAAADAFFGRKDNAAAGSRAERAGWANFCAGAFVGTAVANDADKTTG